LCGVDCVVAALLELNQPCPACCMIFREHTMLQLSPGTQSVPLCLNRMFPGTTYSPPDFFAPNLFPAPSAALFARPCA
jgi:hypothetical protein